MLLIFKPCQYPPQIFKYFSAADLEPPTPGAVVEVEEPSAFAGAGKIMQVTQTTTRKPMQVTQTQTQTTMQVT